MSRLSPVFILIPLLLLTLAGGCRQEEPSSAPKAAAQEKKPVPRVVVPKEVEGQWEAVKIAVLDKENNTREVHTVAIGSDLVLDDSGLRLKVKTFLPAFIMDGSTMTSASNEPKNPAAQVEISEGGEHVYGGWLFSLYPGTHAFQHPRYSFTLVDFVPATKKKVDN